MPHLASVVERVCTSRAFMGVVLILVCSSAARADTFQTNDFVTYYQSDWASNPAATLLEANFDTVYASASGTLQVGIGKSLLFDSGSAVVAYFPSSGPPAALDSTYGDPTTTSSGQFGGDVTALHLDVDFSAAGLLPGTSSVPFGDLILTGFSGALAGLNGQTVSYLLSVDETDLGGGSSPFSIADLDPITQQTNGSFTTGAVTTYATDHLLFPAAATAAPEPSSALLVGLGVAGLGFWLSRRERAAARS